MRQSLFTGLGFALFGAAFLGYSLNVNQQMTAMEERIQHLESRSEVEQIVKYSEPKANERRVGTTNVQAPVLRDSPRTASEQNDDMHVEEERALRQEDRQQVREERLSALVSSLADERDWSDDQEHEVLQILMDGTEQRTELKMDVRSGAIERSDVRARMQEIRILLRESLTEVVGEDDTKFVFQRLPSGRGR